MDQLRVGHFMRQHRLLLGHGQAGQQIVAHPQGGLASAAAKALEPNPGAVAHLQGDFVGKGQL
jgi:hypothetical protein